MAASIGSLNLKLGVSSGALDGGISRATSMLQKFGRTVTTTFASAASSIATAGVALASVGTAMAGLGAVGAVGFGVKLAGEMEQTTVAFQTMLSSADKAQEMIQGLTQFASETPFETAELSKAAKTMLAMGVNSDKVIPSLRAIGDVAAGLGQPIGEIGYLFGQVRSQGRLMGDDLRQFSSRGVPIIAELAKQFGVSQEEVKGLVSEGKVGFNELAKVFESITSQGGQFAGMMEKQSQTLFGKWSTLTDNLKLALVSVGDAAIKGLNLKGLIDEGGAFAAWMKANAKSLEPAFARVGEVLWAVVDIVAVLGERITDAFAAAGLSVKSLTDPMGDVRGQFLRLAESVIGSIAAVIDWARVSGATFKKDVAAPIADLVSFLSRQTAKMLAVAALMPAAVGGDQFQAGAIQAAKWSAQTQAAAAALRAVGNVELGVGDRAAQQSVARFFEDVRTRSRAATESVGKLKREAVSLTDAVGPAQRFSNALKDVNANAFKGIGSVQNYARQVEALRKEFDAIARGAGGTIRLSAAMDTAALAWQAADIRRQADVLGRALVDKFRRFGAEIDPARPIRDQLVGQLPAVFAMMAREGKALQAQMDAQEELTKQLRKLEQQRIDAAKALRLDVEGASVTPLEKFTAALFSLNDAVELAGLSLDHFGKSAANALDEFRRAADMEIQLGGLSVSEGIRRQLDSVREQIAGLARDGMFGATGGARGLDSPVRSLDEMRERIRGLWTEANAAAMRGEAFAANSIGRMAAALQASLDRLDVSRLKRLGEVGQRAFEGTRTPLEKLRVELADLTDAFDAGKASVETFGRAAAKSFAEYQSAAGLDVNVQGLSIEDGFRRQAKALRDAIGDLAAKGAFGDGVEGFARSVDVMGAAIDRLKLDKLKQLKDVARSAFADTRSPLEKFRTEVKDLQSALASGELDVKTFELAVGKAFQALAGQTQAVQLPNPLEQGSAAEVSYRNQIKANMAAGTPQARVEDLLRRMEKEELEQTKLLRDIARAVQRQQPIAVR